MDPEAATRPRFAGRKVVVTGAGSGIGRALALAFAREGAAVACLDVDETRAEETARLVHGEHRATGVAVQCDVSSWADTQAARDRLIREFGRLHDLAANAGGSRGEAVPFLELDEAAWRRMLDRNLSTAFGSGRIFAEHMAARGGGAIVVTSSQLATVVRPGLAHYAAAKGGVQQLVRGMAVDLAGHGVRVNAVAPGPTRTPGNQAWFDRLDVAPEHERLIPLGRVGEPDDITGAALYLASNAASFTTGATITVDGGYTVVCLTAWGSSARAAEARLPAPPTTPTMPCRCPRRRARRAPPRARRPRRAAHRSLVGAAAGKSCRLVGVRGRRPDLSAVPGMHPISAAQIKYRWHGTARSRRGCCRRRPWRLTTTPLPRPPSRARQSISLRCFSVC